MLGVLYDVHGNLPALEAVLEDARAQGAGGYVLGGDYALFGGWPAETLARLRELAGATWVRGNGERWTADPPADEETAAAARACAEALGPELTDELARLPERAEFADTTVVHASLVSDVESFLPDPVDGEERLLGGEAPARLLIGHTHLPFARRAGGTEVFNPGSVGMPLDGDPRAAYALLHPDGRLEHRRVAYDHAASAARLREAGEPWAGTIAGRIERASL